MDLFEKALCFAVEKHSGQVRKAAKSPYILHPLEAASIVGTLTNDREILAAAALHDTVEDTDTTIEEIEAEFGRRVALLVLSETEDKMAGRPAAETWEARKEVTLITLEHTREPGVRMMWLGDKLSNMRSFARLHRQKGSAMWQMFNQKDPAKQEWYYRRILKALEELKDTDAYLELERLVDEVFETEK